MADGVRRLSASVRVRATVGAVAVVAAVLLAASVALVLLQRSTLEHSAEDAAEARATQVAGQVATSGPPGALAGSDDLDDLGDPEEDEDADDEPEDVVVQVQRDGDPVVSSQPGVRLPDDDGPHRLDRADHRYAVATADAEWQGRGYTVVVAVSLEDAEESTGALVPLLAIGGPLVLVVVAGVIWLVVGRALAPVERMRREVATISDDRLDRRVPLPGSGDEVQRLGVTMNDMLGRLQTARDRQRRFVSDASHELRSPISTLRQSGEVAQAHPGAIEPAELAETVVAESLRLQRLVDQLLVLTRTDEGGRAPDRQDVDLDDLVLAEAARVRAARPDLRVATDEVGPARVRGSRTALDQVIRNLADNAMRHARGTIRFGLTEQAGWVRCYVADDGVGVPEEQRSRVFERFVRLDEARSRDAGGSGLGLAIVRELTAAHGGRVQVVVSHEGGALFVVDLPGATGPTTG